MELFTRKPKPEPIPEDYTIKEKIKTFDGVCLKKYEDVCNEHFKKGYKIKTREITEERRHYMDISWMLVTGEIIFEKE